MNDKHLTNHERDRLAVSAIGELSIAQKMAYLMSYFLGLSDQELLELIGFRDVCDFRN